MQYSVVNFGQLQKGIRIDADYYLPEFLKTDGLLNDTTFSPLYEFCNFCKKGIFDISPDYYREKGVPLIRTSEIKDPLVNFTSTVYLDEDVHKIHKKTQLIAGDIVFTKIGAYIGDVAILPPKYPKYNFSQNVTGLSLKKERIESGFLLAYLLSKFGRNQILRVAMLSGQGKLELEDIRNLKIAKVSQPLRENIHKLVLTANQYKESSLSFYAQAEQLLLSELGLLDWKPTHELAFTKYFSDTQKAERFDAEYFQPKYEEVVEAVKKCEGKSDKLGNLVKIKEENFTPNDSERYKYIELANISSNGEINSYMESDGNELPSRARRKVQKGDVIISSIEGSLESIALITENWTNALCSTGFFVVNSEKINSETLLVLLKTKIGQMQLKRGCKGTILTAIGKEELSKIVLPTIDFKIQEQIKEKVVEMYAKKSLSKLLLEIAKRGVETAIEENDEIAESWINDELVKIRVTL